MTAVARIHRLVDLGNRAKASGVKFPTHGGGISLSDLSEVLDRIRELEAALKALNTEVERYAMTKNIGHEGSSLLEAISEARAAIAKGDVAT